MRRLLILLLGIGIGGGAVSTGFHYHILRTNEGILFVPKQQITFNDPYCDVRRWGADEWSRHAEVTENVVRHGRSDLVIQSSSQSLIDRIMGKLGRGRGT